MKLVLPLAIVATSLAILVGTLRARSSEEEVDEEEADEDETIVPPPNRPPFVEEPQPQPKLFILPTPSGFRRMQNSELTAPLIAKAQSVLSQPLGTKVPFTVAGDSRQFIAGVENHLQAGRVLKGVSIFVRV